MFLKKSYSKNKIYYSIVETYRESNKVKHRTLLHLGSLDTLNKQQCRNLSLSILKAIDARDIVLSPDDIQEECRQNWGAALVYRKLWEIFNLDDILQTAWQESSIEFDALNAIFLMLLDRLIVPSSKLKTYETQSKYFELPSVPLQHLYRSLDLLAQGKEAIETALFQKNVSLFNLSVNIVFYDCTTFYFESCKPDELAKNILQVLEIKEPKLFEPFVV